MRVSRIPLTLAAALFLAAALALYASGLRYPLVFDDYHLSPYQLARHYAEALSRFGELRWLSDASFGAIHAAFGGNLLWQRLANLLLHAATATLLFGFLARLFAALLDEPRLRWLAFFGALWFLVNPVAVYGVAYLMQRSIVLATLFCVAALWCVLEGLLRRKALWYAGAAAAYLLALSSKEHAVMLPAVAIALALLMGRLEVSMRALRWVAVFAALGAVVIVQRRAFLGAAYEPFAAEVMHARGIDAALAYPLSVLNQATLFFRYLVTWLLPWPGWISIDLRTSFPTQLLGWPHAAGFVAWLAYPVVAVGLLLRRGRLGLLGFGLLYPWVLALTEVAAARVQEPYVLYRSYLWMSGLPAILPALALPLAPRWREGALAALCVVLAVAAHARLQTFAGSFALWDDALRKNTDLRAPYVERAYVNRGLRHLAAARLEPARADFERALELNPRSPEAYLGRGTLRLRSAQPASALEDFDRAIALDPNYPAPYEKRCLAKVELRRTADALPDCQRAVALDPLNDEPWINLGAVQRSLGQGEAAGASYERALDLNPASGSAHYNYGVLLLEAGRRDLFVRDHFVIACSARVELACDILKKSRVIQGEAK